MQETQEPKSAVIDMVETFIQRLHDLDFVVSETGRKLSVQGEISKPWPNVLSESITQYMRHKDSPSTKLRAAEICLATINTALAAGIINEGTGLIKKNSEAEARIAKLEDQVKRLYDENMLLQAKVDLMGQGTKV